MKTVYATYATSGGNVVHVPLLNIEGEEFDEMVKKSRAEVVGIPAYVRLKSDPPDVWPRPMEGVKISTAETGPKTGTP